MTAIVVVVAVVFAFAAGVLVGRRHPAEADVLAAAAQKAADAAKSAVNKS